MTSRAYPRFHYAFAVRDLEETKKFYTDVLECSIGRTDTKWIDFNFFGHQISAHLKPSEVKISEANKVDKHQVPVRHFGLILDWDQWHTVRDKLLAKKIAFIIEPHIRFEGKVGEQATMFFLDPSGNAIELKSFKDEKQIFAA